MSLFWAIALGVALLGALVLTAAAVRARLIRRARLAKAKAESAAQLEELSKSQVLKQMRQAFGPTARFRNVHRGGVEVVQLVVGRAPGKVLAESDAKGGWKRLG